MAGAVRYVLIERAPIAGVAHDFADQLNDLLIINIFLVRADIVGLADAASLEDGEHRFVVIIDVDPIAHLLARAIELGRVSGKDIGDLAGDELLDVLVRPVIIGAV